MVIASLYHSLLTFSITNPGSLQRTALTMSISWMIAEPARMSGTRICIAHKNSGGASHGFSRCIGIATGLPLPALAAGQRQGGWMSQRCCCCAAHCQC